MKSPFVVSITTIHGQPGGRQEESLAGELDGLKVSGSAVPDGAQVRFDGLLEAMEGSPGITAVGTIEAPWIGDCRRCLGPASGVIREQVREIFEPEPVEGETYPLSSDTIDLEPLMRETIMLELPEAPLHSEDCAGLCPVCGINLNENPGHEHEAPSDPRWSALDVLKDETSE